MDPQFIDIDEHRSGIYTEVFYILGHTVNGRQRPLIKPMIDPETGSPTECVFVFTDKSIVSKLFPEDPTKYEALELENGKIDKFGGFLKKHNLTALICFEDNGEIEMKPITGFQAMPKV